MQRDRLILHSPPNTSIDRRDSRAAHPCLCADPDGPRAPSGSPDRLAGYIIEPDAGRCPMKAIVVTNEAAGTAGMTLVERPEPPAAINDVIVQIHASGFVPTEMA